MATRNLTPKFMKFREQIRTFRVHSGKAADRPSLKKVKARFKLSGKDGYARVPSTEDDDDEEMSDALSMEEGPPAPPAWTRLAEDVGETISRIKAQLGELRKLHAARLLPRFEDTEAELEGQISTSTREITGLFNACQNMVQRIKVDPEPPDSGQQRSEEQRRESTVLATNAQRALASQLQELSIQFRREQSEYMIKLRAQATSAKTGILLPDLEENSRRIDDDDFLLSGTPQEAQRAQANAELERRVRERAMEIQKIAQSITDLHSIMKDMATLVIDQGTLLDQIDHNVENTCKTMEKAHVELQKAETYQKSGRFIKCVSILGLIIVVLLVLLIFKR